jgi:Mrp family chromosome partitioning ATPase
MGSANFHKPWFLLSRQKDSAFCFGTPDSNINPSDLFASEKFAKFAEKAAASYDYVVFYAPSEIDFPDAESLAAHAKQVILSVKYGKTPLNTLKESCCRIKAAAEIFLVLLSPMSDCLCRLHT